MEIKFPNDTQRLTVIGKTGSGKTQFAAWQLSERSITKKPWIVFDFKRDDLLNEITGSHHIGVEEKLPKHPGLYLVHPTPAETENVEKLLWKIWEKENIGVYIDEGYMISDRSPGFQAILTQGRSKHIPVIMLTQRPAWVTRFAFSEADYISLFALTDTRDQKIVKQFMPMPIETRLPAPYYSWWYDSPRHYKAVLQPAPDRGHILNSFHERLTKPRRIL
jgi:hypothetical protein